MQRTHVLLAALTLAAAALAAVPAAEAGVSTCTVATAEGCGGWVCVDENGDGAWSSDECTNKRDLDSCQYQSDCCSSVSGFWCPDRE